MRHLLVLSLLLGSGRLRAQTADRPVVLVVTADASDYLLSAGGTLAGMIAKGATAYVVRVTNDEKTALAITPEEAALRNRQESEAAAKVLGIKEVISLGFRAGELADVPFTTLRDNLVLQIRRVRPTVLFLPNPYTEYDRVLDRYFAGRAAEDAWRTAALDNAVPPFGAAGIRPHVTPEVYYYAQPLDPRRRDPESTATFVPEPRVIDISGTLAEKLKAVLTLRTVNRSMATGLRNRLAASGRALPLLANLSDAAVDKLAEENVRGLATVSAQGTAFRAAEEFRYAGLAYGIPEKYRQ